jgi:HSP20 family protein
MSTLMKKNNTISNLFDLITINDFFEPDYWYNNTPSKSSSDYDIIENEDSVILEMSLAGFKKENIKIITNKGNLEIKAERKEPDEIKFFKKKSYYGNIEKTFTISDDFDLDKIDASFTDGILSIKIPKQENAKLSRVIEIK